MSGAYRPSMTMGPASPQTGGGQFQVGQAPPGGMGSPNLSVNPYLSPYMGMFSGTGPSAQPLFSTPSLSPLQMAFMQRLATGAAGSANAGNIPLQVISRLPAPPPPTTAPGPGAGPASNPNINPLTGQPYPPSTSSGAPEDPSHTFPYGDHDGRHGIKLPSTGTIRTHDSTERWGWQYASVVWWATEPGRRSAGAGCRLAHSLGKVERSRGRLWTPAVAHCYAIDDYAEV